MVSSFDVEIPLLLVIHRHLVLIETTLDVAFQTRVIQIDRIKSSRSRQAARRRYGYQGVGQAGKIRPLSGQFVRDRRSARGVASRSTGQTGAEFSSWAMYAFYAKTDTVGN